MNAFEKRLTALEAIIGSTVGPNYVAQELAGRGFQATAHPLVVVVEAAPGLSEALDEIESKRPQVASVTVAILRDLGAEEALWNPHTEVERRAIHRQATSNPGTAGKED